MLFSKKKKRKKSIPPSHPTSTSNGVEWIFIFSLLFFEKKHSKGQILIDTGFLRYNLKKNFTIYEKYEKCMSFLNEKLFLTPDGVEVPLIFLMDNLRKRFIYLGKI